MSKLCDNCCPSQQTQNSLYVAFSIGSKDPFTKICGRAILEDIDLYPEITTF